MPSRHTLLLVLAATAVASVCAGGAPAAARTFPSSPCEPVPGQSNPPVCTFGVAPDLATATIALVGDSHAAQWRGALNVVARAKGWRGFSMAHSSCPLQVALRDLPEPRASLCATWKREVFAWFSQHPEVHTVFVAGLSGGSSVVATRGRSRFATSVAGYADAWRALLPAVTRVIVIRDTPKGHIYTGACIERALARHRNPAHACEVPRSRALDPDPAIAAASSMPADRVQTVDLTRYFCGRLDCYPVIGGVLVLRDETHMTSAFSTTLGPHLEAAVDAALVRFEPGVSIYGDTRLQSL